MRGGILAVMIVLAASSAGLVTTAARGESLFYEDFESLEQWEPLVFPKIKRHSRYSIVREGGNSFLRAESEASASGLSFLKTFSVSDYPRIRWRWKAMGTYDKGDAAVKSGDDYPLRLYIVFPYDPGRAGFGEKIKYGAARAIYGKYPPLAALNYIWANRSHDRDLIPNAYTSRTVMIPLRGPGEAGKWFVEEADLQEDYRRAFGAEPPPIASLAIMNDADDTGESSVSYIDFIEIYR